MAYPWFRLYSSIVYSPKIRRLTMAQRWYWVGLLALASDSPTRGALEVAPGRPYTVRDVAQALEATPAEIEDALSVYRELSMVHLQPTASGAVIVVSNWEQHQYERSTLRVHQHRRARGQDQDDGASDRPLKQQVDDIDATSDRPLKQQVDDIDATSETLLKQHDDVTEIADAHPDTDTEADPDAEADPDSGGMEGMIHPSFPPSIHPSQGPKPAATPHAPTIPPSPAPQSASPCTPGILPGPRQPASTPRAPTIPPGPAPRSASPCTPGILPGPRQPASTPRAPTIPPGPAPRDASPCTPGILPGPTPRSATPRAPAIPPGPALPGEGVAVADRRNVGTAGNGASGGGSSPEDAAQPPDSDAAADVDPPREQDTEVDAAPPDEWQAEDETASDVGQEDSLAEQDGDAGGDADGDTDADGDADSDTDGDADADEQAGLGTAGPPHRKSWRIEDKVLYWAKEWAPGDDPQLYVHVVFKLWKKTALGEEQVYRVLCKAIDVTCRRLDKGLVYTGSYMQYMLSVLRNEVQGSRWGPPGEPSRGLDDPRGSL